MECSSKKCLDFGTGDLSSGRLDSVAAAVGMDSLVSTKCSDADIEQVHCVGKECLAEDIPCKKQAAVDSLDSAAGKECLAVNRSHLRIGAGSQAAVQFGFVAGIECSTVNSSDKIDSAASAADIQCKEQSAVDCLDSAAGKERLAAEQSETVAGTADSAAAVGIECSAVKKIRC